MVSKLTWWETAEKILKELKPNIDDPLGRKGHHYAELGRISVEKNIKIPKGDFETKKRCIEQASWSLTSEVGRTIRGKTSANRNLFVREAGGFIALKEWITEKEEKPEIEIDEDQRQKSVEISSLNQLLQEVFEETHIKHRLLLKLMSYSDTQLEHLVASLLSDIYQDYECKITRKKGRGRQPWGDILLQRSSLISDDIERIMVEVKGGDNATKARKISYKEIHTFAGNLFFQNIHEGIFVTSGLFYNGVESDIEEAHKKGKTIKIIDGPRLVDIWIERMFLTGEYDYL